jgi:hypothetical protein
MACGRSRHLRRLRRERHQRGAQRPPGAIGRTAQSTERRGVVEKLTRQQLAVIGRPPVRVVRSARVCGVIAAAHRGRAYAPRSLVGQTKESL